MKQENTLRSIICKVDGPVQNSGPARRCIIIDSTSGKATVGGNIISRLFISKDYFLVSNETDPLNFAEITLPDYRISEFGTGRSMQLRVSMRVFCIRNREVDLAEALYDSAGPEVALQSFINQCIADFTRRTGETHLLDDFGRFAPMLQHEISEQAKQKLALTGNIMIEIVDDEIASESFVLANHPVRMTDSRELFPIDVTADIVVEDRFRAIAHKNMVVSIRPRITTAITDYFSHGVTVHEFAVNAGGAVSLGLEHSLNDLLRSEGRKVANLVLTSKRHFGDLLRPIEDHITIDYEVSSINRNVSIENKIQMIAENLGLYFGAKQPDLRQWLTKNLQEITQKLLFTAEYLDLVLQFKELSQHIKNEMQKLASDIGFNIKHLIAIPKLPPIDWQRDFDVNTSDTLQYPTLDSRVSVKLTADVTMRIRSLEKLNKLKPTLLSPDTDIVNEVVPAIEVVTKRFLNQVTPEDFYMNFAGLPDNFEELPPARCEMLPVNEKLTDTIRIMLENDWAADVKNVTLKIVSTELTERLSEIQKTPVSTRIELTTLDFKAPVTFEMQFRIVGVDKNGWRIFQSRKFDTKEIESTIVSTLQGELESYPSAELLFQDNSSRNRLNRAIREMVDNAGKSFFGLIVEVTSFRRELTLVEKQRAIDVQEDVEARREQRSRQKDALLMEMDKNIDMLELLLDKKAKLAYVEDSEHELKQIDEQIETLKKQTINKPMQQSVQDIENMLWDIGTRSNKTLAYKPSGPQLDYYQPFDEYRAKLTSIVEASDNAVEQWHLPCTIYLDTDDRSSIGEVEKCVNDTVINMFATTCKEWPAVPGSWFKKSIINTVNNISKKDLYTDFHRLAEIAALLIHGKQPENPASASVESLARLIESINNQSIPNAVVMVGKLILVKNSSDRGMPGLYARELTDQQYEYILRHNSIMSDPKELSDFMTKIPSSVGE